MTALLPALNTTATWVALVLAAGFQTRLDKGLEENSQLHDLVGTPKGLLPCGDVPLLDHWLHRFRTEGHDLVGNVFVVTNEVFKGQFRQWARKRGIPGENVIGDGTYTNEGRIGAVRDLELLARDRGHLLRGKKVLIMSSDVLFPEDFSLRAFLEGTASRGSGGCLFYHVPDKELPNRGILEVGDDGAVTSFLDRPSARATASRKACPPLYALANASSLLPLVSRFLAESDTGAKKEDADTPGRFLSWMLAQPDTSIYAEEVGSRFDVGDFNEYLEARAYFAQRVNASLTHQLLKRDDAEDRLSLEWKLLGILSSIVCCAMSVRAFWE